MTTTLFEQTLREFERIIPMKTVLYHGFNELYDELPDDNVGGFFLTTSKKYAMMYAGEGLGVYVAKFENPLTIPWDFENETVKLNSDQFADFKKRAYPLVVSFLEEVIQADGDSPSPLSYWFAHGFADEIWDADYDSILCTEWGHPQVVLQSMKQAVQKDFLPA